MKRFAMLVGAALLGGLFTLGILYSVDRVKGESDVIKIQHVADVSPQSLFTKNDKNELVPLDFTAVAKEAMGAVVHIKSIQNNPTKGKTLSDPFERFFRDDFFKDFFGEPYRYEYRNPRNSKPQPRIGTGSGVIINEQGYIVTNNHVIAGADEIEVTLHDKRTFEAVVIGTDASTDLALIQIKEKNLPTIPLVNSDEVEVGEWVLAVGNPFNLNSTVTAGIVSAKGRNINILKGQSAIESFIQTDAAINPGNSGGALVNLQGGLIGINTAIASPTGSYAGYGFAVPSNMVNKVIEDLLKYGVVQRGYLGVMIRDLDGNLAEEKDLEITSGVYVDSLLEHSAADKAGIKVGDVIVNVDGQQVSSSPELQELIGRKRPGDEVLLKVHRKGKAKEVKVTLHNREGKTEIVEKERAEVLSLLGAEFEVIDAKTAKQLNIEGGVKVTKLNAGKLKQQTAMREGFIITRIDKKNIQSIDDIKFFLQSREGGVLIEGIYEGDSEVYYYGFGL
ncbi:MAG: Do family serine endopeptidase [Flammeovirgaceae bacterium]